MVESQILEFKREINDDFVKEILEKVRIAFYKNDLNFDNFNYSILENIPIEQIEYINLNSVNSNDCTLNCTLNDEEKILNLIKSNEKITQQEISNILNISLRKNKYIFKKLLSKNKIMKNGSNKKGKWILNDKKNRWYSNK